MAKQEVTTGLAPIEKQTAARLMLVWAVGFMTARQLKGLPKHPRPSNMNRRNLLSGVGLVVLTSLVLLSNSTGLPATSNRFQTSTRSDQLDGLVRDTVAAAVKRFGEGGLTSEKIALTIIDLNLDRPIQSSHRGQEPIYPASVVKLFYLVAAHHQVEAGTIKQTAELERALHDMILHSSNDATHFVVDTLTGTTAGPELDNAQLKVWLEKRNWMNRYFHGLGYQKINVNQKTWSEGPYGRERQGLGINLENRNKLTTDAVARLLLEIKSGRSVSTSRSRMMMNLLRRDPSTQSSNPNDQASQFSGESLPLRSQYYSKAGWTSTTRHDAAYIRLPNGAEYILVTFTVDNSKQADIIPFVSKIVAESFMRSQPSPDLVLLNGRVWTGNNAQPWAEAVASRGDRIVAVGSSADIRKLIETNTRIIDLDGRVVLPGLIDDHTHFVEAGLHLLSVQLRDATTPQQFAQRIKEHAAKLGPGRWIVGGDWDHENWPGAPLPTKELIDRYTPNNPVLVSRLDGHMALANSLALQQAGITQNTKDPPGGTIVRHSKTGEATGVLKDDAQSLVRAIMPRRSNAEYEEALQASLGEAARHGVTSIQDITLWDHYELYERFRDAGRLTVRIYARTPMSSWKRQAELVARRGAGDEWLRLGGLKAFMDGSLGSTTALFFEPFSDTPGSSGLMVDDNIPEGKLKKDIKDADKAGLQCSIHAIGDKANNLLLNYFEAVASENGPRDRRFRIEHAQHLLPADIQRFARLGIIASVQPYHAVDDGRWAEKRIGPRRIKTTYPFRSLLDSGATLVFGSDWYVAPLSPILGIHAAVTRATIDGRNPDGWIPEQKISVEEAVRAYTLSCAQAEFGEREKGSIEVGKLADLVVLTQDIFKVAAADIKNTEIAYTIVGGRTVYER